MKTKKYIVIAAAVAGGAFFFAAFYRDLGVSEARATGNIISSFDLHEMSGGTNFLITGLTKKADNFCFTEGWMLAYENEFYEVTTTGSFVRKWYPPLPSTGYSHYRGIAYFSDPQNGDCVWAYAAQNENGPPTIIKMKASGIGSIISSFPVYGGYKGGGGLALDETAGYLYHLDYVGYKIYKYTTDKHPTAGSVVRSFDTPDKNAKDRLPYGLAYDGQYLWVTCYGKYDRIVKMTTAGSIITTESFSVPNRPHPHPTAITADGPYLRYVDDATETFYQVDK